MNWNGTSEGSIAAAPDAADAKAPRSSGGPRGESCDGGDDEGGGGRDVRCVERRLAERSPVGSCAAALAGKASFNDVRGPRRKRGHNMAVLKPRFLCYYRL